MDIGKILNGKETNFTVDKNIMYSFLVAITLIDKFNKKTLKNIITYITNIPSEHAYFILQALLLKHNSKNEIICLREWIPCAEKHSDYILSHPCEKIMVY